MSRLAPLDKALVLILVPLWVVCFSLADTVVTYGAESEKKELRSKIGQMLKAEPAAVASRLSYFSKHGGKTNSGRADLVAALDSDEVKLDSLTREELPNVMQDMSSVEREDFVQEKARKRSEIKSKIAKLAQTRDNYLKKESLKRAAEGEATAFDDHLLGTIRTQAASKGIIY